MNVQIEYDKEFPYYVRERRKIPFKIMGQMNLSTLCTFVDFARLNKFEFS